MVVRKDVETASKFHVQSNTGKELKLQKKKKNKNKGAKEYDLLYPRLGHGM